jgi:hypothetical protein
MKLPKQLPAVERKSGKNASVPAAAGVKAAYWPTANPWVDMMQSIAQGVA